MDLLVDTAAAVDIDARLLEQSCIVTANRQFAQAD